VDVGAIHNLVGDRWMARVVAEAKPHGFGATTTPMLKPLEVEGVGTGSNRADDVIKVPICLPNGETGHYESACIKDSDLPALWGLVSLTSQRAVIDTIHNKLFLCGPGGFKIMLSPGSRMFQLEKAETGHLLLPCTEWNRRKGNLPGKLEL